MRSSLKFRKLVCRFGSKLRTWSLSRNVLAARPEGKNDLLRQQPALYQLDVASHGITSGFKVWLCFRLCAFAAEDIISINHRAGLHGKLISYLRYANQATRFRATSTDPSVLTLMPSIKKNDANYPPVHICVYCTRNFSKQCKESLGFLPICAFWSWMTQSTNWVPTYAAEVHL